jgi:hypothetical protein
MLEQEFHLEEVLEHLPRCDGRKHLDQEVLLHYPVIHHGNG